MFSLPACPADRVHLSCSWHAFTTTSSSKASAKPSHRYRLGGYPPERSLYKLKLGGSAGCKAELLVGVMLRLRLLTPPPDAMPAEDGERGDLEGRGVVYDVDG